MKKIKLFEEFIQEELNESSHKATSMSIGEAIKMKRIREFLEKFIESKDITLFSEFNKELDSSKVSNSAMVRHYEMLDKLMGSKKNTTVGDTISDFEDFLTSKDFDKLIPTIKKEIEKLNESNKETLEEVNESVKEVSNLTGTKVKAIEDFIGKHDLDATQLATTIGRFKANVKFVNLLAGDTSSKDYQVELEDFMKLYKKAFK